MVKLYGEKTYVPVQGEAGGAGVQGPQGPIGPQGPVGKDGRDGRPGVEGPRGVAGKDAQLIGPQGQAGREGVRGKDGKTGPLGPKGPMGPQGARGPEGPQGPQGLQGKDGKDSQVPGPEGQIGAEGPQGEPGEDGKQGEKGPKGDKGERGVQGYDGGPGARGPAGAGAAIAIKDEGSLLTSSPTSVNFVGTGVAATAAGDAVTVTINQGAGTGDMLGANNLSDLVSASTSRTNLGLGTMAVQAANNVAITGGAITGITDLAVADGGTAASTAAGARTALGLAIGSDIQAWDADLDALAALGITAAGLAILDDAAAVNQRATLGLVIGTNVQAYDAELAALAGLTSAADKLPYFTGSGTASVADFTAAGRALVDDAAASNQRTTLGLGTISTQDANNVTISGGAVTGITDLVAADGGTGRSTLTAHGVLLGEGTSAINQTSAGAAGQVLKSGGASADPDWADDQATLVAVLDGGGSAITTGVKLDLSCPFACTITGVRCLADQSGSIVVDVWKDTYANYPPTIADTIVASAKPTITTAAKSEDTTLTGWTTSVSAGDTFRFNVDSCTTITRLTLTLKVKKG